jgi:FKBP-type peptidyl-prolyl cis-trans isomerase 2
MRKLILAIPIIILITLLFAGCVGQGSKNDTNDTIQQGNLTSPGDNTGNTSSIVEKGDVVFMDYIGKVQSTGEVFDTSYEDVAKNPEVLKSEDFSIKPNYEPLDFVVGEGKMLPDIEDGVLGMDIGDEKEIVAQPERAYGLRDEKAITTEPRFFYVPRIENLSIDVAIRSFGTIPEVNSTLPLLYWNATVLAVSNENVTLKHLVESNLTLDSALGKVEVYTNESHITIEYFPEINRTIRVTYPRTAKIIKVNETSFVLDRNHPLAGKTLVFQIKVVKIIKLDEMRKMEIDWIEDYDEGLKKASNEAKPIVLYIYSSNCMQCDLMDRITFSSQNIKVMKDDFVWIKINNETDPDTSSRFSSQVYPVIVYLKANGTKISNTTGFLNSDDFWLDLKSIKE